MKVFQASALIFFTAAFFIDLHQNNVLSNLADTVPGNHKFAAGSPETEAEAVRTRNDNGCDTAGIAVKLYIYRTSKSTAGTDIDHFFLLQFADTHEKYLFFMRLCKNSENMYGVY